MNEFAIFEHADGAAREGRGAIGDGAHAPGEYVDLKSLALQAKRRPLNAVAIEFGERKVNSTRISSTGRRHPLLAPCGA